MKFTLRLFAILAIIGLGQTHQFPNFGTGPLHEDLQDILDLFPLEKVIDDVIYYVMYDNEIQEIFNDFHQSTPIIKRMLIDIQTIPEVLRLIIYLHNEGINIFNVMNMINQAHDIKELVPSSSQTYSIERKTGGLRGLINEIKKHIDYDIFISIFADKLKISTAFINFINQLKSNNFQQLVNKIYKIETFQLILNYLEVKSVSLKIVEDIMYLILGIKVPSLPSKTIIAELEDFIHLIPIEKFLSIIVQYVNEDEKVQKAALFIFTIEFHDLLRALEALKEYQAFVIYLEKTGLPVIEFIQASHHAIGMEKYVPPKIKNLFMSLSKIQKIGDGMEGLLKDLYDVLPLDKIDALYRKKLKTSKVFTDFIAKITSKEMKEIIKNLTAHETYKLFITKTNEVGLDVKGSTNLSNRIIGLKTLY
ncbi:PREDICTED: uncharacterized protein LOC108759777 [Trachymyrmex cornetzi]|uniref:Protein G12 n=1 Tax=Trachymyrmex cornetzi TaxID=471704 RepID=A0A195E9N4_9HYME|nr:PREDICTED: uncharacterized protein LOC108759777 [Trachymyrmex cornetzi]KYN21529.1 Protein G12 [Trachymyrmex cornetzi]